MKKSVFVLVAMFLCGMMSMDAGAQLGGLMNKVKNKIVDKALGNDSGSKSGPEAKEPDCASEDAKMVFEFDKGYKIALNEITICIQDGDMLLFSKLNNKYFIRKKNSDTPEGPFEAGDPQVTRFICNETESSGSGETKDFSQAYPDYIIRVGDKFQIRFGGKTYGPYAVIENFLLSSLKTKFVAQVIPDVMFTEKEGAMLEKEAQNAKTLAQQMEMARKMQDKMMQKATSGDPMDFGMKVVSNIPGVSESVDMTSILSNTIKFDEIVMVGIDKITDLSGNTLFSFDPQKVNPYDGLWLSSDNKRYASYNYGILKFSDGKECHEVFSPYITKDNGKTVLNYLYFSPKHNAIMQVTAPF